MAAAAAAITLCLFFDEILAGYWLDIDRFPQGKTSCLFNHLISNYPLDFTWFAPAFLGPVWQAHFVACVPALYPLYSDVFHPFHWTNSVRELLAFDIAFLASRPATLGHASVTLWQSTNEPQNSDRLQDKFSPWIVARLHVLATVATSSLGRTLVILIALRHYVYQSLDNPKTVLARSDSLTRLHATAPGTSDSSLALKNESFIISDGNFRPGESGRVAQPSDNIRGPSAISPRFGGAGEDETIATRHVSLPALLVWHPANRLVAFATITPELWSTLLLLSGLTQRSYSTVLLNGLTQRSYSTVLLNDPSIKRRK